MSRGLMSVMRRWHSRSAALLDGAQAKIRASLNNFHTLGGGGDDGTGPWAGVGSDAWAWTWALATYLLDGLHHGDRLASPRGAKDEVWGWPGHARHDVGHGSALLLVRLQLAVKPAAEAEAELVGFHSPLRPPSPAAGTGTHRGWKGPEKRDLW